MNDTELYRQARRAVERKIAFLIHLLVYLIVNSMLFVLNDRNAPPWHLAPLLGWGIGLLFHGLSVWARTTGAEWKCRMIEQELKRVHIPPNR